MTKHSTKRGLLYWFIAVSFVLHMAAAAALWLCPPCQLPQFSSPRRIQVALQTIPVASPPAAMPEVPSEPQPPKESSPPPVVQPEPVIPPPAPRPKPTPAPPKPKPLPKPKPQPQPQPKVVVPEPVEVPSPSAPTVQVQATPPVIPVPSAVASQPASVDVPSADVAVSAEEDWQVEYGLLVRHLIEKHKRYPLMARRGGMEGVVELDFTIARDGRLVDVLIKQSSGYEVLDQAALRAVRSVGTFPPLPDRMTDSELSFKVPLAFRLTRN